MSDRSRLYASVFLRALSVGLVGVLLGYHLGRRGFDEAEIGNVVAAGLWGMALVTLLVATHADRVGRRRTLVLLAVLVAAGVLGVTWTGSPWAAAAGAFLGMLNGAGRDRGALPALEQAVLAATATDEGRTRAYAVYNLLDDGGLAVGALLVWLVRRVAGAEAPPAALQEGGLLAAAVLLVPVVALYAGLSPAVEPPPGAARTAGIRLSPASRGRVARIAALFALDGVGGGFLAAVFLALFFRDRFGAPEDLVAILFFGARVLNALSHLGAAWLARRFGLLNTMVFTHAPSSLLLLTVAVAPSFPVAAVLFLLREGLVEMDVPTRQSYVMAIVRPEERTAVSAITNLVRIVSWAVAAWVAGHLMRDVSIAIPLAASAVLKLTYDALLYVAFRRTVPPEEQARRADA